MVLLGGVSNPRKNNQNPFLILGEQILGFVKYGADGLYSVYCPFGVCEGSAKGAA